MGAGFIQFRYDHACSNKREISNRKHQAPVVIVHRAIPATCSHCSCP